MRLPLRCLRTLCFALTQRVLVRIEQAKYKSRVYSSHTHTHTPALCVLCNLLSYKMVNAVWGSVVYDACRAGSWVLGMCELLVDGSVFSLFGVFLVPVVPRVPPNDNV